MGGDWVTGDTALTGTDVMLRSLLVQEGNETESPASCLSRQRSFLSLCKTTMMPSADQETHHRDGAMVLGHSASRVMNYITIPFFFK